MSTTLTSTKSLFKSNRIITQYNSQNRPSKVDSFKRKLVEYFPQLSGHEWAASSIVKGFLILAAYAGFTEGQGNMTTLMPSLDPSARITIPLSDSFIVGFTCGAFASTGAFALVGMVRGSDAIRPQIDIRLPIIIIATGLFIGSMSTLAYNAANGQKMEMDIGLMGMLGSFVSSVAVYASIYSVFYISNRCRQTENHTPIPEAPPSYTEIQSDQTPLTTSSLTSIRVEGPKFTNTDPRDFAHKNALEC